MSKLQYIEFDMIESDILWITPLSSNVDFRQPEVVAELNVLYALLEEKDIRKAILDLSLLSYFGSTLLEWMVTLWKKLRERRGAMVLYGPTQVGRDVLTVVRFDNLWPITDIRAEAVRLLNEQIERETDGSAAAS